MMSDSVNNIEQLAINTIRTLSMDAVQAANSGHPGTTMALAPLACLLYNEQMRYNPARPAWAPSIQFVLDVRHVPIAADTVAHEKQREMDFRQYLFELALAYHQHLCATGRQTDESLNLVVQAKKLCTTNTWEQLVLVMAKSESTGLLEYALRRST